MTESKLIKPNTDDKEWTMLANHTLNKNDQIRFDISINQHVNPARGLDREELLAQQGICGFEEDSKRFSKELSYVLGEYMSEREMENLIECLQKDLEKFKKQRASYTARK